MATTKIKKELISDQAIDASKLDVTGNGTAGQALLSDGDGTFSWGAAGESYTAGAGLALNGTEFSNTITDNSQLANGAGYITSYTEVDTLDSVVQRGSVTAATVQFGEVRSTGDVIAYYSSDERLKDNINPIENALDKVNKLGGYEFDWNNKQDSYQGHDIGVVAQEVEAIFPELVITRDNGFKAVKYEKLVAVLVQAIKELSVKVNELENKL